MNKKLLVTLLFFYSFIAVFSQTYHNEWIDYNKTYYKFKVGPFGYDVVYSPIKSGVVRIPQSTLAAAGLGAVNAEQFQLWRNGEEVPLYVSKPTGRLGAGDYIEFLGTINDGVLDKELYPDSSFQLSDYWSLQTDTASYFLTTSLSNAKRYNATANNVSNVKIAAEKNFMFTVGRYFRNELSDGYGITSTQTLHSSTYDRGEGFTSRAVHPNNCGCSQIQLPQTFPQLFLDTSGAAITAFINSVGNTPNSRSVSFLLNNQLLTEYQLNGFITSKIIVPNILASTIKNDTASFIVQDLSPDPQDEIRVATIKLNYPRLFNFGNASNFEFYLDASDKGRYIKINNFSVGSAIPVLYDITNGKRYEGNVSVPGVIQFVLKPSLTQYHLVLVRGDGSTATVINSLQNKNFVDFSNQTNQGNYLIISNPLIYGSGSSDYIQQYAAYRNSVAGGSFISKVIDINELTDQFAYGIKKHPLSIKNFLKYARDHFSTPPAFVFLVGKGVTYNAYRLNEANALAEELNLVPTWGSPGSDNLLSSSDYNAIPATPIGRLSAVSAQEVDNYLNKIKQYEAAQQDTSHLIESRKWMKNVLQLTGADDPELGIQLDKYMQMYKDIISDTFYGGNVINFSKTGDAAGYPQAIADFKNIYEKGSGLLTYFGHSSSTNLDFNLDNPAAYNNTGKYPVFIVNGCSAGNIFDYDANRLNLRSTISEKFVLEPDKGSIGFLATSSFGVSNYLNIYTRKFYLAITKTEYGKEFGEIMKEGLNNALNLIGLTDFYGKIHAEQYTFHGDPALKMNTFPKPDYAIDSSQISISPNYISVADDSFYVTAHIFNLGKAVSDSVHFSLSRTYPDGTGEIVFSKNIQPVYSNDSIIIKLPLVADRDKGISYLTASINDDEKVDELSYQNNTTTVPVTITDAEIRPIYPYNFSIVNKDSVALSASTADPLEESRNYIMQIDTTALFNSPLLLTTNSTSTGGVITFNNISLNLNTIVYYWRVAQAGPNQHWNMFSFTHNNTEGDGFEQAHFYQHTQSSFNRINLDSATRTFDFSKKLTNVFVRQAIYPTSGLEDQDFSILVNGSIITASACIGSSIIFNVFDTLTFKPMENTTNPFGAAAVCDPTRKYNFEYNTQSAATRKNAMDFYDNIPNGSYVIVRRIYDLGNQDWAPTVWARDTAIYGSGNSLYNRFKSQGLAIDSFTYPRTFVFLFRKNDSANFTPVSEFSQGLYDKITLSQNITSTDTLGYITSPEFGPSNAWHTVTWNGYASSLNDIVSVDVIGVKTTGEEKTLYSLNSNQHQFDISGINVKTYPFLKLRMKNQDSITAIPYQLQNWSVQYTPVPEGAIAPNLGIKIPDEIIFDHDANITEDTLAGFVTFKNVSKYDFKKLKLKLVMYDELNNAHEYILPKTKVLRSGDTLQVSFIINVTGFSTGMYNLLLQVNTDNDQPEEYQFNNTLYKYIYIFRAIQSFPIVEFNVDPLKSSVLTKWSVKNETNIDHYEVQRSNNTRSFITIGNLNTTKEIQNIKYYNLTDNNPVTGKNFYRLKIVKLDKSFSYSSIKEVDFGKETISVYPNPFHSELNISVNKTYNTINTVTIYTYTGQIMMQKRFLSNTTLNVNKLANGSYIVQVNDGLNLKTFKLEKQK